jgi:hypothetical protein
MSKNQLFKIIPDEKIILALLSTFQLNGLQDDRYFTKDYMIHNNTVQQIIDLIPELTKYYIRCKSKIYLSRLNEKKCITILRQFLKTQNYNVLAKEKTKHKVKYSTYRVIQDKNRILSQKKKETRKIVIDFST